MDATFLDLQIGAIAQNLEPSETKKEAARRSQRAIREALDTGNMSARIIGDYLSGSYARHTAITPLDDVDIIFIIDPSEWKRPFFSDKPDPVRVLETFARAIRLRYAQSRVETQRRSVGLKMHHLDIDVVPAITTNREDYVLIPDREKDEWILTAPIVHGALAAAVNGQRHGLFKPLVKVLKGWNSQLRESARLKSFTIETMALRVFRDTPFNSLFEGCLLFFDFLCGRFNEDTLFPWDSNFGVGLAWLSFSYELLDSAGTGSNLLANLSEERRAAFLAEVLRTRDLLVKAHKALSEESCQGYLSMGLHR